MFEGAHLHLLLNHVPILGPVFVLPLLVYGILKNNRSLAVAALLLTVAVSVFTIPAFLSGEEAEESVEGIMGVSEATIEEHEEQAEIAYYGMLMAGAIALGALLSARTGKPVPATLGWLTAGVLVVVFVLMARSGNSGGKIRHTELNRTISSATMNTGAEHDDD